jgi:hypothetical protein
MTILDNYMFRPLLAIFMVLARAFNIEVKKLIITQQNLDVEISPSRAHTLYTVYQDLKFSWRQHEDGQ